MSEGANPLGAGSPLLAVDNFLSEIIHPDYTVFGEDDAGGGEPVGFEVFRLADGRRSVNDYATAENANAEWRIVAQLSEARIANFIAFDRGHNLEGRTITIEGDDDPNFSSATQLASVTIPSTVSSGSDVTASPGVKTTENAWIYFFGNQTTYENYRILVPALGTGEKPRIVGAFLGFAWEPVHASILPFSPDGTELRVEETISEAQWAGASRPAHRRFGNVRIAAATYPDRQNTRRYVESMLWRGRLAWWVHDPSNAEESWLGRVPSGAYDFTETHEWPLGETTFTLREHEPAALEELSEPITDPGEEEPGSGETKTVGSAIIGATDFSEFSVGAGVPVGITPIHPNTTAPAGEQIANDATEGNYFACTPGALDALAYIFDAFSGISGGDDIELLARIWIPAHTTNRRIWGPAFQIDGTDQTDLDYAGGGVYMRNASDYETTAVDSDGGSPGLALQSDWQEVEGTSQWMWQRIRIEQQGAGATQWRAKTWSGALGDEPAGWDGDSGVGGAKSVIGNDAIGWAVTALVRRAGQRIAWLSFSTDPSTEPPPEAIPF